MGPKPDTTAPVVNITYPTTDTSELGVITSDYEQTGNGLLDLRVEWSDGDSGIDPSSFTLSVQNTSRDEQAGWTQVSLDASGLSYEETIEDRLRQGLRRIIVTVADSAGNVGVDTLPVQLGYGDLHRSVKLNVPPSPDVVTTDMVVCPDDERLYATSNFTMVVMDANSFDVIGVYPEVLSEAPARVLCIEGDPHVYATVRVNRFNRETLTWATNIPGTFGTDGIAASRQDTAILWAGEIVQGVPVKVDRIIPERVGGVGFPGSTASDEFVVSIAVLDDDEKIYFTRFFEGGLVVGDPATGEQLAHIDLDPFFPGLGVADNIVVSPDDRYIYANLRGGDIGVAVVDTELDETVRIINAPGGAPIDVALNPAGNRLWLTVRDDSPTDPAPSLLIDPQANVVLQEFPKPVPPGTVTKWVQAATFHPNGKLLFQARDDFIEVYLIR